MASDLPVRELLPPLPLSGERSLLDALRDGDEETLSATIDALGDGDLICSWARCGNPTCKQKAVDGGKVRPDEKVGVHVLNDGRPHVVEYSEISKSDSDRTETFRFNIGTSF